MIKTILASKTHNPHYLTKYITFITNCQKRNESYKQDIERHHICPKADDMFPEFSSFIKFPWNCAALTPRQHFIAHLLLYKTYPDIISQGRALYLMSNSDHRKNNSKLYHKLRIETAEASKGKLTVKDENGNTFRTNTNDPRYISGEWVHISTGVAPVNRVISVDQVIRIRIAMKDPTSIITENYIANVVKKSQKDKVGKIPFEELKYQNGHYLTYKALIITYYAAEFNVDRTIIAGIVNGKTYKGISLDSNTAI